MPIQILVVEDEPDIAGLIAFNLKQEGYLCFLAIDARSALEKIKKEKIDFIILDLMLPGMNGLDLCRNLKANPKTQKIPVLILTAKGGEIDRVVGFELGADDYMVKPFSPRELILRIKAILKRMSEPKNKGAQFYQHGLLRLDTDQHRVWVKEKELQFTATEFKLLEFFLKSHSRILTREILLDQVWGYEVAVTTRTIDTHVKRLREKLGEAGEYIETVRGVGYRLAEEA
ncbi:MAG: response regulator transcription factor [Deltaproteobacteria bacterium]|nr:response regulator transcription factor [Deltaproteobacteria bacterium]